MQLVMTFLVLGIWLWIGTYGFLVSRKKKQPYVSVAWALLTVVIAVYILSALIL